MGKRLFVHPSNPSPHSVAAVVEVLRGGDLVALPTDASYSIVWALGDAEALERARRLRGVDDRHLFTLFCRDLSTLGHYARVDNRQYRLLRLGTPGPFTFILEGSHELPRKVLHPKRRTVGLRVPGHPIVQAVLAHYGAPLLATTAQEGRDGSLLVDPEEIEERLGQWLSIVVDSGERPQAMTTVVDLTTIPPVVVRQGAGDVAQIGLVVEEE
ncbi:MAG: L-threonylcarbamoyladenylate synthase [Hydrogenophilus sp.]|nr:L-threonylcarbamoyladenylate synthase [Hydrogenophilus sp.]